MKRLFITSQTITDKGGRADVSSQVENNDSTAVLGNSHRDQLLLRDCVSLLCMDLLRHNSGTVCTPECNCSKYLLLYPQALQLSPHTRGNAVNKAKHFTPAPLLCEVDNLLSLLFSGHTQSGYLVLAMEVCLLLSKSCPCSVLRVLSLHAQSFSFSVLLCSWNQAVYVHSLFHVCNHDLCPLQRSCFLCPVVLCGVVPCVFKKMGHRVIK